MQKLERWKEVILVCDKILKMDPKSVKSIYRKGLALKHLQEFEKAISFLNKYKIENIEILPDDALKDIDNLLILIKIDLNEYNKKEKNIFASMFAK